jgi:V/A-type H+-transporting ATPase subunit D
MSRVSATRMELLARKAQIALASQGRTLLEQKRTALFKEFLRTADRAVERSDALEASSARASQALARAEALAGAEAVRSAAMASRGGFNLEVSTTTVMGVRVPRIERKSALRSMLGRGCSIVGASTSIDETAAAFEDEVEAIVRMAETELRLVRLGSEIQRTSRRLNALEHLLIPRLKAERNFIQMALDERERADHFRLKLVKRSLEKKRESSSSRMEVDDGNNP